MSKLFVSCAWLLTRVQLLKLQGLPGFSVHGGSPGKNTEVGCHILLQGISKPMDQTQVYCIAGRFF